MSWGAARIAEPLQVHKIRWTTSPTDKKPVGFAGVAVEEVDLAGFAPSIDRGDRAAKS